MEKSNGGRLVIVGISPWFMMQLRTAVFPVFSRFSGFGALPAAPDLVNDVGFSQLFICVNIGLSIPIMVHYLQKRQLIGIDPCKYLGAVYNTIPHYRLGVKLMLKKLVSTTTALLAGTMMFGTLTFAATGKEIGNRADNYLGDFKYKWGAEPWNSGYKYADCSSFTKLVFSREGVYLPRTSREQAKKGKYVAKRNLVKGDLVFFDTDRNGSINHVGIYMGNGRFIHSSPVNKVGFSNLNYGYWEDRYVTARRVR